MADKQERSTRYELRLDVAYDDGSTYETAPVTNLSESGLFLQTAEPLPPGKSVRIVPVSDAGKELFELLGEVVRTEDGERAGMGVRFKDLSESERDKVRAFCEREAVNVAESLAQGLTRAAEAKDAGEDAAHISLEELDAAEIIELDPLQNDSAEVPRPLPPPPVPLPDVERRDRDVRGLGKKAGQLVIRAWSEKPVADEVARARAGTAPFWERLDGRTVLTGGLVAAFLVLALSVALLGGRVGTLEDQMWQRDGALSDGLGGVGQDLEKLSDAQGGLTDAMTAVAGTVAELTTQAAREGLVVAPTVSASGGIVTVATSVHNRGLGDVEVVFQRVRIYAGKARVRGASELNPPLEKGPVRWRRIVQGAHVTDVEALDEFKALHRGARRALERSAPAAGALSPLASGEHTEDTLSFALPESASLVGVVVEVGAIDSEGRAGVQKFKRVMAAK